MRLQRDTKCHPQYEPETNFKLKHLKPKIPLVVQNTKDTPITFLKRSSHHQRKEYREECREQNNSLLYLLLSGI